MAATSAECGLALARNAEQHLRSRLRLAQLYRPEWLGATLAIAARCVFRLDELRYEYPAEIVPPGMEPTFEVGEQIFVSATVSRTSHMYCYFADAGGNVMRLTPNMVTPHSLVAAHQPNPLWRNACCANRAAGQPPIRASRCKVLSRVRHWPRSAAPLSKA